MYVHAAVRGGGTLLVDPATLCGAQSCDGRVVHNVGHSLGGGAARWAGIHTGVPTTIVDAPPHLPPSRPDTPEVLRKKVRDKHITQAECDAGIARCDRHLAGPSRLAAPSPSGGWQSSTACLLVPWLG